MKLFDAHIHLQEAESLTNLKELEICAWINCGTSALDWQNVNDLSQKNKKIIPSYGFHPWFLNSHYKENWKEELTFFLRSQGSLVGEIGLDYMIDVPRPLQKEIFLEQWKIALDP